MDSSWVTGDPIGIYLQYLSKSRVLEPFSVCYRFSGGIVLIMAEKCACAAGSTGWCFALVLAGSVPRKLLSFQFTEGLTGRGTNPPPQFGQTFPKTRSTHAMQKVHS
jgi:hypothetical protein